MSKGPLLAALLLLSLEVRAQWEPQTSGTDVRFRGVSAVSAQVAWASGQRGTFARTTDGGKTWKVGVVPGAEDLDFRDVDAFDAQTAYLLAIGEGEKSRIYKTTDGGKRWTLQFRNTRPTAFFDCMAFWDRDRGIAMSDPVDGRFLVITTSDGGRTWEETHAAGMPPALPSEGGFAASGTCVAVHGRSSAWFGSGGPGGARIFRSIDGGRKWDVSTAPLASGPSGGVFSLFFRDALNGIAVGGDYKKEGDPAGNIAITTDGGRTWRQPTGPPPSGFRSLVALARTSRGRALIAIGPSGSDSSFDGGESWAPLGTMGFHAAAFSGTTGWAVGEAGSIARFDGRHALRRRKTSTR